MHVLVLVSHVTVPPPLPAVPPAAPPVELPPLPPLGAPPFPLDPPLPPLSPVVAPPAPPFGAPPPSSPPPQLTNTNALVTIKAPKPRMSSCYSNAHFSACFFSRTISLFAPLVPQVRSSVRFGF